VKVIGDGFMAAFHTAAQALTFCMEVQNVLLGAPWPEGILETPYPKGLRDEGKKGLFSWPYRVDAHPLGRSNRVDVQRHPACGLS
jgi:hypothetical protein